MRPVVCFCLFLAFISGISAQDMVPDTILNLNDVNIYSSRISRFAKGQEMIKIDSLTRSEYPAGSLGRAYDRIHIVLRPQLRRALYLPCLSGGHRPIMPDCYGMEFVFLRQILDMWIFHWYRETISTIYRSCTAGPALCSAAVR